MKKYGRLTKEKMLKELSNRISQNKYLFITNFEHLSVSKVAELRRSLNSASSSYFVVKNSLTRVAFKNSNLDELSKELKGISGLIFTNSDPIAISKILASFSKGNQTFVISSAFVEGKILNTSQIKELSQVPPREILLARAVCAIKYPISSFVLTLAVLTRNFVYVLEAIRKKKESQAKPEEAPLSQPPEDKKEASTKDVADEKKDVSGEQKTEQTK